MPRYYFDIRMNHEMAIDEEGLELSDLRAARVEAASSLANLAKDLPQETNCQQLAIEVRTEEGLVFKAAFI